MPTFKHPCPYCGKFIQADSAACPFCDVTEPFSHGRCPDCRATLQAGWIACPKCGRTLTSADTISPAAIGTTGAAMEAGRSDPLATSAVAGPAALPTDAFGTCSGCGAPLAQGARFCQECGTLAG